MKIIPQLRTVVIVVAALNIAYFGIEFAVALTIRSVSLFADSIDFLEGASVNLLIGAALAWSATARAHLGKALAVILLIPSGATLWTAWGKLATAIPPAAVPLSLTGTGALLINLSCAFMLARFRENAGSLTRAAFLSARNDKRCLPKRAKSNGFLGITFSMDPPPCGSIFSRALSWRAPMHPFQSAYVGRHDFPRYVPEFLVRRYFSFDARERSGIRKKFRSRYWVSAALQLGFVRMTGTTLRSLEYVPTLVLRHLGKQFRQPAPEIATLRALYRRDPTRFEQQRWAIAQQWFNRAARRSWTRLHWRPCTTLTTHLLRMSCCTNCSTMRSG